MRFSIIQLNFSATATLGTEQVAFVERFKQESMYGLSAKKVTVVERLKQESMYGLSAKKGIVVERLKQESVYGLSAKKSGRWREVIGISLGLQRFGGLTSQTSEPKKRKLGNIISQNR